MPEDSVNEVLAVAATLDRFRGVIVKGLFAEARCIEAGSDLADQFLRSLKSTQVRPFACVLKGGEGAWSRVCCFKANSRE